MKKNSLTTAIIAGVAGVAGLASVAHAVNLNPDGLGQVLLYPYYTVNGGNSTMISVVNTTDQVKAVKVRFLESVNSAEVLDFNLYLSPYDVWNTEIVSNGAGAAIHTNDTSCTVPHIPDGTPFVTYEFTFNTPDELAGLGLARVRQGHAEIIEMGVVVDPYLAAMATHVGGVPRDCDALVDAWDGGDWSADSNYGMETPSGGLFGAGTIVSADWGRALSYNADAIDGFYTAAGNLHYPPGDVRPTLSQPDNGGGNAVARIFSNGNLYQITYTAGRADATSAVLTSRYIYNEYYLSAAVGANSEWVVTFPTKRMHVEPSAPYATWVLPFTKIFTSSASCHAYDIKYWDREERTTSRLLIPSPPPPTAGFGLCYEANVIGFNQDLGGAGATTTILGAAANVGGTGLSPFTFSAGWARLEFDNPSVPGFQYWLPSASGQSLVGHPVTGFWVSEAFGSNASLGGVPMNLGALYKHRVSRDCRQLTPGTSAGSIDPAAPGCPTL